MSEMIRRLAKPKSLWLKQYDGNPDPRMMFHGSNSPSIEGQFVPGKRDSGWFGSGMYTTMYPEYASRWGQNLYAAPLPDARFAEAWTDYRNTYFDEAARRADKSAGGTPAWLDNQRDYSQAFRDALLSDGYQGMRVGIGEHPDAEIVIFDPESLGVRLSPYTQPVKKK